MTPELAYFLKVNVSFILLYAFYRLFFYKDTFFKLRRTILLAFFGVSLLYPLMNIQDWIREQEPMAEVIQMYSAILPETAITSDIVPGTGGGDRLVSGMSYLYWGGVIALLLRLFVQLSSILLLAKHSKVAWVHDVRVHVLKKPAGPFSFFRLVFLHPDSHSEKEIDEILAHECTHVNQWHSIDVIVCELVGIICWVNPFVWLLKREVRHNLEYLADDKVLESGYDCRSYQYHLLGLAHTHKSVASLSNNFNMMHLRNRISMMNKKRSRSIGKTKYLIFIPVVGVLLLLSNVDALARITDEWSESVFTEVHLSDIIQPFPMIGNAVPVERREGYVLSEEGAKAVEHARNLIFTVVEKMPEFPGGQEALLEFLQTHAKYPESAIRNGIEGRVYCSFVVGKDGTVSDADVLRGVSPELDQEALRVINTMPAWSPGKQRGKAVRVRYTVPVAFRLADRVKKSASHITQRQVKEVDTSGRIFTVVQRMPEFPGGQASLVRYMATHVKYPVIAQENGIQGRVSCSFVVDTDGSLKDIEVIRGIDPSLDKEAVRVIREMPKWHPGMQNNRVVAVKYTIPVTFRLQ